MSDPVIHGRLAYAGERLASLVSAASEHVQKDNRFLHAADKALKALLDTPLTVKKTTELRITIRCLSPYGRLR